MFNQELKERFINEYTTSASVRGACIAMFNAFEKYEIAWGSDLCTRSTEELQPVVDELVGIRERSRFLRVTILREYTKWCIKNDVRGACDGTLHLQPTGVAKMKRKTVKSPLHLQVYLNQICEPEDEKTTDNIYRCYYWLAYGGMQEKDILDIKTDDVDLSNMSVKYNEEEYPIYREALKAFKNCKNLSYFVFKHPNYSMDKQVLRARADGDALIRGIRSNTSITSMRVELSRRSRRFLDANKTNLELSYYRVWISGLFYRAYERERAGLSVDFKDAAIQHASNREHKLSDDAMKTYIKRTSREYQKDYERWKLTLQ